MIAKDFEIYHYNRFRYVMEENYLGLWRAGQIYNWETLVCCGRDNFYYWYIHNRPVSYKTYQELEQNL